MDLSRWIQLHQVGLEYLGLFWPIGVFLSLVEAVLLQRSKRFTQRGAIEATVTTSLFFLLVLFALDNAPAFGLAPTSTEVGGMDLGLAAGSAGIMILLRALLLKIFFRGRTFWQALASAPLPLFVYFTAWVALK